MLYIPTRDMFERHAASGLTRYAYDAVAAAAADADAAAAEYEAACQRAYLKLGQNIECYLMAGPSCPIYKASVLPLLAAVEQAYLQTPDVQASSYSAELFPVRKWEAAARKYRALARRIDKALGK